jgi:trigger factor
MKITVEEVGPCRKVVKIEVPAEVVSLEYRKIVGEFAKRARIPGFRPGKAPAAIIEKQFVKEVLEETREQLLPRAYREAVIQEKLQPVAIVDVGEVHVDKALPLAFKVTIDVHPEFTLPEYKGIEVKSHKVEIKDADIDQVIVNLRERNAHFEPVTGRPSGKNDVVEIDYEGTCDGRPLAEVAPENPELAQGKDFWVLLTENAPLFLPGLPPQLEGMAVGDTRTATVSFPADYRVKAVAGKEATYSVTARGIRERMLPEMNDEFVKSIGVESVEDLQKKIRENLEEAGVAGEQNRQKDEVVKWLMEHTEIKDLPQSMVEEEARHIIQNVVQENVRRGVAKEQIEANREDIFNRAAQSSSDRVKLDYILSRIAETEKVEVKAADLDKRISDMAGRHQMPLQRMKAELEKGEAMKGMEHSVRMEKAVDAVLALAVVTPE